MINQEDEFKKQAKDRERLCEAVEKVGTQLMILTFIFSIGLGCLLRVLSK